jgi:hypothetical protein
MGNEVRSITGLYEELLAKGKIGIEGTAYKRYQELMLRKRVKPYLRKLLTRADLKVISDHLPSNGNFYNEKKT